MKLLIVYASSYGQTERIARRLAEVAGREGAAVTLVAADAVRAPLPDDFDRIVVAGSVLWGKHQKALVRFVKRNAEFLGRAESTFVSISGAAGSEGGQQQAREYVDKFVHKTRWKPGAVVLFAGGMAYSKLGWLTKRLVIATDRKLGIVRDPSRDYDYTDWDAVDRLAVALAADGLKAPRTARQAL